MAQVLAELRFYSHHLLFEISDIIPYLLLENWKHPVAWKMHYTHCSKALQKSPSKAAGLHWCHYNIYKLVNISNAEHKCLCKAEYPLHCNLFPHDPANSVTLFQATCFSKTERIFIRAHILHLLIPTHSYCWVILLFDKVICTTFPFPLCLLASTFSYCTPRRLQDELKLLGKNLLLTSASLPCIAACSHQKAFGSSPWTASMHCRSAHGLSCEEMRNEEQVMVVSSRFSALS